MAHSVEHIGCIGPPVANFVGARNFRLARAPQFKFFIVECWRAIKQLWQSDGAWNMVAFS